MLHICDTRRQPWRREGKAAAHPRPVSCGTILKMTKLQQALEKIAALPQAAQDDIAEQLLRQVKRVQRLRAEILKRLESFDRGRYTELDAQEIIKQARATYMADR
jgi:hypothetical protein